MATATRHPVQWLEQLQQQASTAAWMVILGPLPTGEEDDWIAAAGRTGVPVLVIEPQLEQANSLREQLNGEGIKTVTVCPELLAATAGDVCWYRYNDARRNGTTPLEVLQPLLPNLRLEGLERRRQRTLAEVLDAWSDSLPQPPNEGGLLWLPAELVQTVLAGCGPWLQRLQVLQVAGEPEDPAGLAERLEALCFRLDSEASDPQLWRLDALRVLQAERDRLVTERDGWIAEREGWITERDGLIAERDGLLSSQRQISTELDQILALLEATPGEASQD
ncbi:MAG: hypothetical protein NTV57_18290 [Cyanobacteria bacterium]|nr:hypothetical protein [Cyanobacteriota bacterium]